jgi:hypothetical protein
MGRNGREIAERDPALAALMGIMGSDFGDEFEAFDGVDGEPDLFEGETQFGGISFGEDDDDMGLESIFGAAAPSAAINPQVAQRIVQHHMQKRQHRDRRLLLLEPNKYSEVKVERYTFSVSQVISTLGTAQTLGPVSNSPDVNFRPQRVTCNSPSPGFVLIAEGRVANVSFTVGGTIDSWQFNANSVGQSLDVPTLTPANKATFTGNYTALVPTPLSGTGSYTFIMSFTGPASIVA